MFDIYEGVVVWMGEDRHVLFYGATAPPLIGMAMREDSSLLMHVRAGGRVEIRPLS